MEIVDEERERLLATVAAVREADGITRVAAEELGISASQVRRRMKRAGDIGIDGATLHSPPIGRNIGKVTTQVNALGIIERQWIREHPEGNLSPEDLAETILSALKDVEPLPPVPIAPLDPMAHLLSFLPLADLHMGMMAWQSETGQSWDLKIADKVIRETLWEVIARTPPAGEIQILGLGDITHADNNLNVTPGHGNRLDADNRHRKTLKKTIALLIDLIRVALGRFPVVNVRILEGNHDPQTAQAISVALSFIFADEPRVIIDENASPWWWRQFGKVFLGATHGHTLKPEAMPGVMAADNPVLWGQTTYRYIHRGHLHHKNVVEELGVPVECHRAPIPKDAYHAGLPYRSGRTMQSISYHKNRGEHSRVVVNLT